MAHRDRAACRRRPHVHCFSPDGKRIATTGGMFGSGELLVLDVATGKITHTLNKQTGPVQAAAFAPDSRTVVSSGLISGSNFPYGISTWDAENGELQRQWKVEKFIQTFALSPDGKTVAVPAETSVHVKTEAVTTNVPRLKITLRDLTDGKIGQTLNLAIRQGDGPTTGERLRQLAYSPDGTLVAALISTSELVRQDGNEIYTKPRFFLNVWDVKTGAIKATLGAGDRYFTAFGFFPDSKRMIVGDSLGAVQIWIVP